MAHDDGELGWSRQFRSRHKGKLLPRMLTLWCFAGSRAEDARYSGR